MALAVNLLTPHSRYLNCYIRYFLKDKNKENEKYTQYILNKLFLKYQAYRIVQIKYDDVENELNDYLMLFEENNKDKLY